MKRIIAIGFLPHFNVLAYSFSDTYQNSEQRALESLTLASHIKKGDPNNISKVIR
jgi:hypothetical protein